MNKANNYDIVKFIDGEFELEVSVNPKEETIWMTQEQMSILFNKAKSTINEHIKNILKNELDIENVVRKFGKTELSYIKTKYILMYNLDMILAVGYRVKSKRGIMFRQWANKILKEYLLKGYVINENRVIVSNDNYIELKNQ
ncbi:MAG: virulence RhuM family protein, partial [Bacilli bacterium]|nr:virulence RhuM family protein [Bacilli bacterium]